MVISRVETNHVLPSAGWIAQNNMKIQRHIIGDTPCKVEILLAFTENAITVQMQRVCDLITEGFAGRLQRIEI